MKITKRIIGWSLAVAGIWGIATSCNETLNKTEENRNPPEMMDFSPRHGVAGTEISITGANLKEVDSIKIGGVKANVVRINQSLVVAGVTNETVTGEIELFTPYGSVKSGTEFTMEYAIPKLTSYAATSTLYTLVTWEGENLDLVKEVYFGTKKAEIRSQSDDDIQVKVPFFVDDKVDIILKYQYGTEIREESTEGKPFTLILLTPAVTDYTRSMMAGYTFDIEGENLSVVDSVYVGGYKAPFQLSTDHRLTCQLSGSDYQVSGDADITFYYFDETQQVKIAEDFRVIVPEMHIWNAVKLYAEANPLANFFNGHTGAYYNPCQFEANEENIHLAVTTGSGGMQIGTFYDADPTKLQRFKCGGKGIPKSGLPLRFRKLKESNPVDKMYMDKIRNHTLEYISVEQATADGLSMATKKQVIRHKAEDVMDGTLGFYNEVNDEGITIGGINLFMVTDEAGRVVKRIGFVELVKVERTIPEDTKGACTVNFYFQKDESQTNK